MPDDLAAASARSVNPRSDACRPETLTAIENVALPLLLGGGSRRQAREKALAGLSQVGLSDRAEHFPEEISGGEMQRVAIARALVTEPEAILCDEPTGNLDSVTSKEILTMLRGLPEAGRRSVVMVTHDPQAAGYGDRLITLRDGLIESEEILRDRTGGMLSRPRYVSG